MLKNELIRDLSRYFGYYENDEQTKPSYDPGLEIECIICGKKLSEPIKTVSLMPYYNRVSSYFYRTHKECYENLSAEEICKIDSLIIDAHS
jgi:hypothetical protein